MFYFTNITVSNSTSCFSVQEKICFESLAHLCTSSRVRQVPSKKTGEFLVQKKFNSLVLKIDSPKATALLYKSGKIVLLGLKNADDIKTVANIVSNAIKIPIKEYPITSNWVGSFSTGETLKLNDYVYELRREYHRAAACFFEPEIYPALVLHPEENSRAKCLIYQSGKVVITGCGTLQQMDDIYLDLTGKLTHCKCYKREITDQIH